MPRTGRPRALDETKQREVCALITAGCGMTDAASYVGCAPSTIRREARRNSEFNEQLRRASLSAELMPLNAMRRAASTHWRAAAWLLERTNVQRFAKQNVRHVKPDQIEYFAERMGELLYHATRDKDAADRFDRRMKKIIRQIKLETIDAECAPLNKPRRSPKESCRGNEQKSDDEPPQIPTEFATTTDELPSNDDQNGHQQTESP